MPTFRFLLLTAALMVGLAACGSDDSVIAGSEPDGSANDGAVDSDGAADSDGAVDNDGAAGGGVTRPWIGGDWVLQSMTVDGAEVAIPAAAVIDLTITGPDRISGNAGCNSIGGVISAPFDDDRDGGALSVTELQMTEIGCALADFEVKYVNALVSATEWELAPPAGLVFRADNLELVYGIGAPPAEVAFENTEWTFDTIYDGEGIGRTASTPAMDRPQVTLVIADGQAVLSSQDCGVASHSAEYQDGADGPISFDEAIADACADPDSNMTLAAQGLADSTGFQVFDGRLTFIGLPGETVSFTANP